MMYYEGEGVKEKYLSIVLSRKEHFHLQDY